MSEIKINIEINAPIEKVFEAITSEGGVKAWWTNATVDSEKARFEFNEDYVAVNVHAEKPNKVEWDVTDSVMMKNTEWNGTKVIFELSGNEEKTNLNFVHEGFKEETELFKMCIQGWNHFMKSLKLYLETGKGTPFTPDMH